MVAQKANQHFLAKMHEFSEGKPIPERQRSGVVQTPFSQRSDVVQNTVQVGSTGRIVSPVNFASGHVGCSKNIARPGASCEFLPKLS